MKFITHEEYKKKKFGENPKLKELYEKEKLNYTISIQLKELREKKRISQFDLAKKVGMTQSVIARIEGGNSNISMKTFGRILGGLGATVKIKE